MTVALRRYKTTDFRTIFFWAWFVQALSTLPDLMIVSRANVALGLPDHAFMIGVNRFRFGYLHLFVP